MRKLLWLLNGVVLGFVAAHFVNQTPAGRRFFARVNRGVDEFNDAFVSGYRDGGEGADQLLDDVEDALRKLRENRNQAQ